MDDRKMAFSAMLISAALFLTIGFLDYYALLVYKQWDTKLIHICYRFLTRFDILQSPYHNKGILVMFIVGSAMIYHPKKKEGKTWQMGLLQVGLGGMLLTLPDSVPFSSITLIYALISSYALGFVLTILGTVHLFQVMDYNNAAKDDPFNDESETFLQMEKRIDTPYSVNIPYEYRFKKKLRKGWINFVNLFRALLIIGTPGSGKSFALIEEIIEQLIDKLFTLLIYDFKFDTLSKITYNYWRRKKERLEKDAPEKLVLLPEIYMLCFDNMEKTHRANPINPYLMKSQTDASDAASIIMKNLNREWIKRNDFFSRSAISFVSGLIWYLKKKAEELGKNICTLPHVITLSTVNIEYLLEIMLQDLEVRSLMIPFKDALEREAVQQLAGQTASAQISLSMLANKELFYVMTGNDFQLDINNPKKPKIVCIQNNPNRSEIYSAPIGLYINKILQVVNKPGCRPLGLILDELPTIFIMGLRKIIDTGRSHYVATIIGIQSITQLIADYGKELADVIFDNCSNVFSGAAKGETARRISEIFGKIHQEKKAKTITKNDTTTNISTAMLEVLPKSKITSMSTGHFGGIVADTFEHPIKQKLCYGLLKPNMTAKKIQNNYETPMIHDFKNPDHDEKVQQKFEVLQKLDFYYSVSLVDFDQVDYIDFVNGYLEKLAGTLYDIANDQIQFVTCAKELQLFDHLQKLKDIINDDINSRAKFDTFMMTLLDRMLINREIDKTLTENFRNVIEDIDEVVKNEYYKCTGEFPKSIIFDKNKMSDELENEFERDSTSAENFNYEYEKLVGNMEAEQNQMGSREKATFDTNAMVDSKDLFNFSNEDDHEFTNKTPIETLEG